MYDELIERLRELHPEEFGDAWDFAFACQQAMHEAADAIEELSILAENGETAYDIMVRQTSYIEELQKKIPRWIPVTERLPLYGQDVLVVRTYGDGEKYQEVLMAHIAIWNEKTGEKWWNATNITHWMPLPEPPKGEEEC